MSSAIFYTKTTLCLLMNFLGGWFTNHHMCIWVEVKEDEESMKVEVKEEEETMKPEVIIIVDLGQSLLMK